MAVNCSEVPREMEGSSGVTAIESSWGGPTVNSVPPETASIAALIVAEPTPELATNPCDPVLLLATATNAEELVHVTFVVMSFVVPSE